MRRFLSWPIRVHMYLLVWLLALPAIGLIVHSGVRERQEALENAGEGAEKIAYSIASEIRLLVDNTRQLSLTLSHLPEVRSRKARALNPVLHELQQQFPYYTFIFVTDKDGTTWASSQPGRKPHSLFDRRYIRDALATGRFSAGEYVVGKASGLPTISFGYPFKDKHGAVTGVIGISLDLKEASRLLVRSIHPLGATYGIYDHRGTLLYCSLKGGRAVGAKDRPDLFRRMLSGPEYGIFDAHTNDGVYRRVAYRKLRLAPDQPPYMYVRVGIPHESATRAANSALFRDLALYTPFLLAALAIGWSVGRRCVLDRVHALQTASRCLADGDLSVRVADRVKGGELGELAQTFDGMALALQAHERELREKSELLHAVIEGTSDAIYAKDLEGRYLLFNSGAAALTGKSAAEIIGRDETYLFPSGLAGTLMAKDGVLVEDGRLLACEEVVVDAAGSPCFLLTTKGPIRDARGDVSGMFGIARDITRRKRAEQERERLIVELENERLRFESVLQQMPAGVVIVEAASGMVTFSNVKAAQIFRDTAPNREAIDYGRWRLFQPDGSPLPWQQSPLNCVLHTGESAVHLEHLIERCDDTTGFVSCNASAIRDIDGRVVGSVAAFFDITDRKQAELALRQANDELERRVEERTFELANTVDILRGQITDRLRAEQALRESRETFRQLIDNSPAAMIVTQGKRLRAELLNRKFTEIFGYDIEEVIDLAHWLVLAYPDVEYRASVESEWAARFALAGERRQEFEPWEKTVTCKNGTTRRIEFHHSCLGERDILTFFDITDRRRAEEELKRETTKRLQALEQLRENERFMIQQGRQAAMGEMISNIAHQWRQPLNILGMTIQRLKLFHDLGDFSAEFLATSAGEAMRLISHMSGTIDDFSNFFRPDKEIVTFSVNETISKTIALVEANFQHQEIGISVHAEGDPQISGYPNEYSQALLNILLNARDAFAERTTAKARITLKSFSEGDAAVVTIADNAGGIPAEIMDKIFDPHFTTKGPKGTGIGLFMTKNIVERNMSGLLTVRNTGQGAEFRIEV